MRGLKRVLGFVTASALFVTALPVNGVDLTVKADTDVTADKTVRLQPNDASTFHDTDGDGFGEFEGWGTSLCWWANRLGYSEAMTNEAAEAFFGDTGLEMNIGRYNIGGGDNVGTEDDGSDFWHESHIQRSDSIVPGYATNVTKITSAMTEEEKAAFDRADEECGYAWNYDWNADENQMNILKAAADASGTDFIAEAFSNSPPYFMTESGCSSGNTDSSADNLRTDSYNAFAAYMADVIVHWAEEGVINFQSATPMNEPDTSYWGANSNKQEGCHFDPGRSQSEIIVAFAKELKAQIAASDNENVKALASMIFSASDETSIDSAITNYNSLSDKAKEVVTRIDTHTYSGSKRQQLRETAEEAGENLWMSEVDGAYVAGTDADEMGAALGLAQRIITDLNGLKSSAWILWNAVDMHVDSDATRDGDFDADTLDQLFESTSNGGKGVDLTAGYWGIAIGDHNNQKLVYTKKYDAYGQFSKYIKPGYTIIGSSDSTLAAFSPAENKAVVVAINTADADQTWKFDLSSFATMGSTITANRTSGKADREKFTAGSTKTGERWADVTDSVDISADTENKYFTTTLLANSITTYTIEGVTYEESEDELAFLQEISLQDAAVTGSEPWNNNTANGPSNVVDGDTSTFFDGVADGWVQIDLGVKKNILAVAYAPRTSYAGRCVNASFYGSTDGATWTTLYTITETPPGGTCTMAYLGNAAGEYRYIKYAVPSGDTTACCNVSEIKLYGEMEPLSDTVSYYEELTEGKTYSDTTKAVFDAAMASALKLIEDNSEDKIALRDAAYALEDAYNALVEIKTYDSFTGVDGAVMCDTDGNVIQAHGGQIQQITYDYDYNGDGQIGEDEHTYWYWVGEDKTNDYRPCPGIRAYISKDLYNWKDMGDVLRTATDWEEFTTDDYFTALYGSLPEEDQYTIFSDIWKGEYSDEGCVIERPKMLYNDKTKKYVIWFHADGQTPDASGGSNYAKAKAGVAISDSPFGPFVLQGTYRLNYDENEDHGFDTDNAGDDPLGGGGHVRDMNLFKDNDGTAYVIYSSDGNETMHIAKLNDEYTGVANPNLNDDEANADFSRNFIGESREAPAMFKYNNKYYLITSGCTGWYPNQASYAVADNPLGPWTTVGDPCTDTGSSTTYDTQSTCVFPVDAENGKFIYMGDRWSNPDEGYALRDSRYVWLPVEFLPDNQIALRRYSDWTLEDLDNKDSFSIETDLPETAVSVDELKSKMPSAITIQYASGAAEDVTVTWSGYPTGDRALGTVTLTGTLSNGRVTTYKVNLVDEKLIYFFDCAAEEEADYITVLKETLGSKLRNEEPDQRYTTSSKAGYTGILETDFGIKTAGTDVWAHGYWAESGKNIEYAFKLEAGTYTVATGYQEWWSTARATKITVTSNDKTLASDTFTLASTDSALQKNITFTITETSIVKVTVSKNGSVDPVLSWIAVMQDVKDESLQSSLIAAVAEGEALNKDLYTTTSWNIYAAVLEAAKALLQETDLSEADVNTMVKNLNDAKAVLELKKTDSSGTTNVPSQDGSAGGLDAGTGAKSEPVIICDDEVEKAYGDKAFNLGAEVAAGTGALTYSSSDRKVAIVSADGTVTIKGTGICTITVSLAESADYTAAIVPVTLTVRPKTVSLQSAKGASGKKLTVKWKKTSQVTGYEVSCALNKTFKSGKKTVTVKSASKTSTTITKLKKGKKYYVRVRAYKTLQVNGKSQKLYSDWSKVKTSTKVK